MAAYGRLYREFWRETATWPEDARWMAAYLLTNSHGSSLGLYRLPPGYAHADLVWSAERFDVAQAWLTERGFAMREGDWVFIRKALKRQAPRSGSSVNWAVQYLEAVPRPSGIWDAFLGVAEQYAPELHQALASHAGTHAGTPTRDPAPAGTQAARAPAGTRDPAGGGPRDPAHASGPRDPARASGLRDPARAGNTNKQISNRADPLPAVVVERDAQADARPGRQAGEASPETIWLDQLYASGRARKQRWAGIELEAQHRAEVLALLAGTDADVVRAVRRDIDRQVAGSGLYGVLPTAVSSFIDQEEKRRRAEPQAAPDDGMTDGERVAQKRSDEFIAAFVPQGEQSNEH